MEIKKNDVVQIVGGDWTGALCQVDEVRSWGVICYVYIPGRGTAYKRCRFDEVERIGAAVLAPQDDEE